MQYKIFLAIYQCETKVSLKLFANLQQKITCTKGNHDATTVPIYTSHKFYCLLFQTLYMSSQYSTDFERAKHMLTLWNQDDEDASVPGLAYTLTGLGLTAAADILQ
jgi:hypothetical protein